MSLGPRKRDAFLMERYVYIFVSLLWLTASATAQQPQASAPIEPDPILAAMKADSCKRLGTLEDLVDGENETEIAAAIAADPGDSTWDTLIDCYEGTRKPSERVEALRVAAQWERLRADAFQKSYRDTAAARPVSAPACKVLNKLDAQTKAIMPTKETIDDGSYQRPDNFGEILAPLIACSTESKRLNAGKPVPEYVQADTDLAMLSHADHVANENRLWLAANGRAAPITSQGNTKGEASDVGNFATPVTINTAVCDQVVTVAGLTPNGLALYVPPEGQRFMAKNAKNYPRMCLLQDATGFVPGVPRYLLV